MAKRIDYRTLALRHYGPRRVYYCGFAIPAVLQVAHIDGNRRHNDLENLVVLCPTCHRMLDLDLIPNEVIIQMRDRPKTAQVVQVDWQAVSTSAMTRK